MRRFLIATAAAALLSTPAAAKRATDPPAVSIADVTCSESVGNCTLTITKAPSKSYSIIAVTTGDGTAKAGSDYQPISLSLTLGNTVRSKTVTVPIINNSILEAQETFSVSIKASRNANIIRSPAAVTITDDDSPPPPTPTPAPSPTLAGETAIADNFNAALAVEPTFYGPTGRGGIPPVSADTNGSFRFLCSPGQFLKDDPIVKPGQAGGSHTHQFLSNTGTTASSTYSSLRTTGGTTCGQSAYPVNRSSYWLPEMLDGAGNAVKPDYLNVYYKQVPHSNGACSGTPDSNHLGTCVDLPNGIRYVTGYNMADGTGGPMSVSDFSADNMYFQCWPSDDGLVKTPTGAHFQTIKAVADAGCPIGAQLVIIGINPSCWNGTDLDSADHRSHMSNQTGAYVASVGERACPPDKPYVIPSLQIQYHYTVDANFVAGKWHLVSDEMVAGALPGQTLHFDYWEAWSPTAKATWMSTCINGHLTCSSGDMGNGTYIIGMGVPNGGWTKHVLVPAL